MRILVTGGAGFIGSNLIDAIPPEHQVAIFDNLLRGHESVANLREITRAHSFEHGDVRDEHRVREVIRQYHIDLIFHLAAMPSHRLAMTRPPMEYVKVDLLGTLNIVDAAREYGASIVFASSNKVYGHQPIPWREDMPLLPEGPYGQAKASAEDYLRQYAKYHGIPSVAIRFHHVLGKRCHSELVLPIFTHHALHGELLTVNGRTIDGRWESCAADWTNIDDVVQGLIHFIEHPPEGFDVFNFGSGKMETVEKLAQLVSLETHSYSAIVRGEALSHEGIHHLADIEKARAAGVFESTHTLGDSVHQYVEWHVRRAKLEEVLV